MPSRVISRDLRIMNNLIMRYFEKASTIQYVQSVTGSNTFIIRFLARHDGSAVYQKDIEENFSITRSTTSRVLALMEKKNLIVRESVEGDKRLKRIVLTDKAWALHKSILEEIDAFEATLTQNLSEEEIDQFLKILTQMKTNLENVK